MSIELSQAFPAQTAGYQTLLRMKFLKYLLVPWITAAVYSFVSIYNGAAGIVPYRALLREREKILENLQKLEGINKELEGTMDALLYDSETIRIRARELGYGGREEYFVRIVGLPGARYSDIKPGMVRTAVHGVRSSAKTPRFAAFCTGLAFLVLFLSGDLFFAGKDKNGLRAGGDFFPPGGTRYPGSPRFVPPDASDTNRFAAGAEPVPPEIPGTLEEL